MTNKPIGTVTLTAAKNFTQYSEHAAWTDYVQCEPQTVELRWTGYWLVAEFTGILSASSFPSDATRRIGQPATAHVQWSHTGFDPDTLREHGFDVVISDGRIEDRGTYGLGTTHPGRAIRFYAEAVRS